MSKPAQISWLLVWYAGTIFVSAFLVFQVQPVISKTILPWFGGTPGVWTTCLLFFQTLLFGGYAYAHMISSRLAPRWQGLTHFGLILAALMLLPIVPDAGWKPEDSSYPTFRILMLLGANVGLPYFLLSSTGPLMQAWFSRHFSGRSPYRLYSLSNVGSLLALLTYPLLVEPAFTTTTQGSLWSVGFCVFALFGGYLAVKLWQQPWEARAEIAHDGSDTADAPRNLPSWGTRFTWLFLAALASTMLLATTNHVCQDVAVIPFLWVIPLSLYLLSFIICFDNERWYRPLWYALGAVALVVILSLRMPAGPASNILWEILVYFAAMFFTCMICHGELVRRKPHPRHLTMFYLMCAGGGAVGGIFVTLVCPHLFTTFFEMNLGLLAAYVLGIVIVAREWRLLAPRAGEVPDEDAGEEAGVHGASAPTARSRPWFVGPTLATLGFLGLLVVVQAQFGTIRAGTVAAARNFYGILCVKDFETDRPEMRRRVFTHGQIAHGYQFLDPEKRREPTSYYARESGIGVTFRRIPVRGGRRVGVVGLGVGTVAAYGCRGDYFRFYEINPEVVRFAREYFTFLADCPAKVDVVLGDGRLSLEREPPQRFDLLVLDAFSGDAIPTHLLTSEAFDIYRRHVKPDGVIATHISNRYVDLVPVLDGLAKRHRFECLQISLHGELDEACSLSEWMVLTNNRQFLDDEVVRAAALGEVGRFAHVPLWTDDYSNLFQILK